VKVKRDPKPALYLIRMRWLICTLASFWILQTVDAALLFQDRHVDATGQQTTYSFEANSGPIASTINESMAAKAALSWARGFYRVPGLSVVNIQERTMPAHYWLVALNLVGGEKSASYYAIILPNGSVLEPKVWHENVVSKGIQPDVTKDTELIGPEEKLEIHGEMMFFQSWGKGPRNYGPYVPSPLWGGPADPLRP